MFGERVMGERTVKSWSSSQLTADIWGKNAGCTTKSRLAEGPSFTMLSQQWSSIVSKKQPPLARHSLQSHTGLVSREPATQW